MLMKSINAEQELADIKRDIELKDVKIESLQNIIKKRGLDSQASSLNDTQKMQDRMAIQKLNFEKEQLSVENDRNKNKLIVLT